jgi:hypothetical protein
MTEVPHLKIKKVYMNQMNPKKILNPAEDYSLECIERRM